jgi:hypothetical protein
MQKKRQKLFLSALALTIATPLMVQTSTVEAATNFSDVSGTHYAYKEISDLVDREVINGFSDGTFRPTNQVNRAEFAAFAARALELPSATSSFKDVPKTAALYDGVSRAYKAGIIKGFSDGSFKPSTPVNRQDMAVMIDRAMQLKGNYTQSKALNFGDKAKVGAYAKTSVERLYYYNVMGAFSGSNFAPTTIGTRAETARFLYNMLTVVEGGVIVTPNPPSTKSYMDMTLAELKATYPQYNHVIVHRQWKPEPKILVNDMLAVYHHEIHTPFAEGGRQEFADVWTPQKYFDFKYPGYVSSYAASYIDYPMEEVIAYNGKSYKDSPFMAQDFQETDTQVYNTMPSQPTQSGQFLIDIHRYDNDFVVYRNSDIKWDVLAENPVVVGTDYVVDLYGALQYATGVTMANGGLEIAYNGQKIVLSNGSKNAVVNGQTLSLSQVVSVKNGLAYGPIREIVEHIGLYTKDVSVFKRIEITNYQR